MNGKREQGRVGWFKHPSASPSGRRRVWGCDTRAFSPGFNMAGPSALRTRHLVAYGGNVERLARNDDALPGKGRGRRSGGCADVWVCELKNDF